MRRMLAILLMFSTIGMGLPLVYRTVHRRFVGVNQQVTLEGQSMEYYYIHEVRVIVEQMANRLQKPPVNATIDKETGEIIPHQNGIYIDIDQTMVNVAEAAKGSHIQAVKIEVVPPFRTEHLMDLTAILGNFTTPLMGSPGRVSNIQLSLDAINNTLVMPGEVFSFNEVVGERTPERGYKNAPIILGETVVPGVGGGICQTSSTLYNAVRGAELEIVERRIHSIAPSYIQHGRDAAVAWPYTDFKFANNTDQPVIVKAGIDKWRVRVWILGSEGSD